MIYIEDSGGLEPGDEAAIVCNDAVVIVGLTEDKQLKINVILGEPERIDVNFE